MSASLCVYEIDADDRIVFCNEQWDLFAIANGGDQVTFENVKGRVLWDYFADPSTADLYRRLVSDVRKGRPVQFSLRCDSPETLRLLGMSIVMTETGRVRFATHEQQNEPRDIEDIQAAADEVPLLVCSWCGRVNIDDETWREVDVAVRQLKIFEQEHPPAVSHGICSDCYRNITALLATVD